MSSREPGHDKEAQQSLSLVQELVYTVLAFLGFAGIGLLLAWYQSLHPILGGAITDPAAIVFITAMGIIGASGFVFRPRRQHGFRRVHTLHDEVRRLAEAGETYRAIRLHNDLTGDGWSRSQEAVDACLSDRQQRAP